MHCPLLSSILLVKVQSLENKLDELWAYGLWVNFQYNIRDYNLFYFTETWLTPAVPDLTMTLFESFTVL